MSTELLTTGTHELADAFPSWGSAYSLVPGPSWKSFEGFRINGPAGLEQIPVHGVGTLQVKGTRYRILRDADFLCILGRASEAKRAQQGIRYIRHALEVWKTNHDQRVVELAIEFTSFIADSPALPEQVGHDRFAFQPRERHVGPESNDEFDILKDEIPTPEL